MRIGTVLLCKPRRMVFVVLAFVVFQSSLIDSVPWAV